MKSLLFFFATFSILFPISTLAQDPAFTDFKGFVDWAVGVVGKIIPVLVGFALLVFLFGLTRFILSAGDREARTEGKHLITYGIIGLFVIVSVWGIVRFLGNTLGWF